MYRAFLVRISGLLLGLSLAGCYAETHLTDAAPGADAIRVAPPPPNPGGFPVHLTMAGEAPPGREAGALYALAGALRDTGLYPAVYLVSSPDDAIAARLEVDARGEDAWAAWNVGGMVLAGMTAFLLSPALPQIHDVGAVHRLRVRWPNGAVRTYAAACGARSVATLDKDRAARADAETLATRACLNALVNRMSADQPGMTRGLTYARPAGVTTSRLEMTRPAGDRRGPEPGDVCAVLGYAPGSKAFNDCLAGVY